MVDSTTHKFKRHRCNKCGGWFIWMRTVNKKIVAVDVESFEDGDTTYDRSKHSCHWETCSQKQGNKNGH